MGGTRCFGAALRPGAVRLPWWVLDLTARGFAPRRIDFTGIANSSNGSYGVSESMGTNSVERAPRDALRRRQAHKFCSYHRGRDSFDRQGFTIEHSDDSPGALLCRPRMDFARGAET